MFHDVRITESIRQQTEKDIQAKREQSNNVQKLLTQDQSLVNTVNQLTNQNNQYAQQINLLSEQLKHSSEQIKELIGINKALNQKIEELNVEKQNFLALIESQGSSLKPLPRLFGRQ